MSSKPIILIGPMSAGKSTVAKHLAKLTKIPNVPIDRVRFYYYFKDGFSLEKELDLPSFTEVMQYWKPFEVKAVRKIIAEFPESIIDFGAGHSYYPDPKQFAEVKNILEPLPNIFLLLPCEDNEKSLKICNQRLQERRNKPLDEADILANKNFIHHESNYHLAKHIVYTEGKTPEKVAEEISAQLS